MMKILANLLIKIILKADNDLKNHLFKSLMENNSSIRYATYRKKYTISGSFKFNGDAIQFYGNGKIMCGQNSYIGSYSTIQSATNCKVVIGNNCSISHNVRIYTSSNTTHQNFDTLGPKNKTDGDVLIGNGVWIGANVFIKEGITIGNNSVIGANSVVTKDVLENGIYGGVPAKLIRMKGF
jgi:maltose O-acetyltransferase